MPTIVHKDKRYIDDGPNVVYDLKRVFLGGKENVYTANAGKIITGKTELLAWWQLSVGVHDDDGGNQTIKDSSGHGHTLYSAAAYTPELDAGDTPSTIIADNTLRFGYVRGTTIVSGKDQVYTEKNTPATDVFSFNDGSSDLPFSVSAWIKPGALADRVISKGKWEATGDAEWVLYWGGAGDFRWYFYLISDADSSLPTDPAADATYLRVYSPPNFRGGSYDWTHIVVTYDGSQSPTGLKLWMNGEDVLAVAAADPDLGQSEADVVNGPYTGMVPNRGAPIRIGAQNNPHTYFNGNIADVAIWSGVLDEESARALYYAKDRVSYQIRNYNHKGSTAVNMGEDMGLKLDDFLQGHSVRSLEVLYSNTRPMVHSNADPLRTVKGKVVDQRWFDETRAPLNLGAEGWSRSRGHHPNPKKSGWSLGPRPIGTEGTQFFFDDHPAKPVITQIHGDTTWPGLDNIFPAPIQYDPDTGVPLDGMQSWTSSREVYLTGSLSRVTFDSTQGHSAAVMVPNHRMENRDLGMTSLGVDDRPWTDLDRFNPVTVISADPYELEIPAELLGTSFSLYSRNIDFGIVQGQTPTDEWYKMMVSEFKGELNANLAEGASYSGISLMDGVIEAFPIRKVVDRSSIDVPFQPRGCRGEAGPGQDTFRRSFFIEDQFSVGNEASPPWLDSVELFGTDIAQQSGSFTLMGIVIDNPVLIKPFKDTTDLQVRMEQIKDIGIRETLFQWNHISGSRSLHYGSGLGEGAARLGAIGTDIATSHGDLKPDHTYAAHGFDYIESELGTDSIVYGGLKR